MKFKESLKYFFFEPLTENELKISQPRDRAGPIRKEIRPTRLNYTSALDKINKKTRIFFFY